LGKLYAKQGRLDEAEEQLRRSVGVNPKFYTGHFELAGILEQRGNLSEAVREYRVAEPGFRASADYQYRLGFAYFRLNEPIEAREHLTRAIEMAPGSPVAQKADELLAMMR
jgi:tetratricopeptide (TPR) repeat protein